jgi:hypothetical protein
MIKRNSSEWATFINRLNTIKQKSNREVLCIQCWQMLNCKQKIKHLKQHPDHKAYLLTSTQYASEQKICELAQGYDKLIKKNDGEEYLISPFAPVNLPLLNEQNYGQFPGQQKGFSDASGPGAAQIGGTNFAPHAVGNQQFSDRPTVLTTSSYVHDINRSAEDISPNVLPKDAAAHVRKQGTSYGNIASLIQKGTMQ